MQSLALGSPSVPHVLMRPSPSLMSKFLWVPNGREYSIESRAKITGLLQSSRGGEELDLRLGSDSGHLLSTVRSWKEGVA